MTLLNKIKESKLFKIAAFQYSLECEERLTTQLGSTIGNEYAQLFDNFLINGI